MLAWQMVADRSYLLSAAADRRVVSEDGTQRCSAKGKVQSKVFKQKVVWCVACDVWLTQPEPVGLINATSLVALVHQCFPESCLLVDDG